MRLRLPFRLLAGIVAVPAIFALVAIAAVASIPERSAAAGDCTADASLDSEEQAFLVLINNHRAASGRAPLNASYLLSKSAQWKSQDMGANNYFAHDDLFRTWAQRTRDCGYNYNTYRGENIAAGNSGALATFNQWKNSPGHNQNMLSTNFNSIGIGRAFVPGSRYGWYWTTNFGGVTDPWPNAPASTPTRTPTGTATRTPAPATATPQPVDTTPPTISVQSPAHASTVSGTTTVNISSQDFGGVQKVRVWVGSRYLGFDSTAPYSWQWDTRQWPDGIHVITVESLDNANNSKIVKVFVWVNN